MDEKYLKEISNKLTVIIKLLISRDDTYKNGGVEPIVKLLEETGLSDEEMAEISGKAVQTVANTKSRIKKDKRSKRGKRNGK